MNNLIIIEEFEVFAKVNFYTLRYEDSDLSETDKFFERFTKDDNSEILKEDLPHLENFQDYS